MPFRHDECGVGLEAPAWITPGKAWFSQATLAYRCVGGISVLRATLAALSLAEFTRAVYIPSRLDLTPCAAANILRVAVQFDQFSALQIGDLSDESAVAFLRSRMEAGARPATVNSARQAILCLWRCAWRKGVLETLPRDVPRMREPSDPPRARRTEELLQLLNFCASLPGAVGEVHRSDWWTSLFSVIAATAERPGAVIQTRSEDLDLDTGTIRIRSGTVKTRRGRVYSLTGWAIIAVTRIFDPCRTLLWPWPHCRRHLYTSARRIMERAGLHPSRERKDLFYSLRRWNLSYLAAESLELAQQQSGHASVSTLLRFYVDPVIAGNRRAMLALPCLPSPHFSASRQLRLF